MALFNRLSLFGFDIRHKLTHEDEVVICVLFPFCCFCWLLLFLKLQTKLLVDSLLSCNAASYGATCVKERGRETCKCLQICPAGGTPVCGSDFKNYTNQCALNVAHCKSNGAVTAIPNRFCGLPGNPKKSSSSSDVRALYRDNKLCRRILHRFRGFIRLPSVREWRRGLQWLLASSICKTLQGLFVVR